MADHISSSRKRRSAETIAMNNAINTAATSGIDTNCREDSPTVTLQIRLKRFHAVASWSWNANDDVCGICQNAFEGVCPGVKFPGEDCPVVWGKCGHAYHLQCISKWLTQPSSKNACPICRQDFSFGENPVATSNSN